MAIEKIGVSIPFITKKTAFRGEQGALAQEEAINEELIPEEPVQEEAIQNDAVEKNPKNTGKVVTALSLLAAISAAGVAIYKHKEAKEAIKKAEEEAQQKIKEAEEKAKKAIEEAEKKLQGKKGVNNNIEKGKDKAADNINKENSSNNKKIRGKRNRKKIQSRFRHKSVITKPENIGNKKAAETEVVDKNFIEYLKKGENGIISVPERTKISKFVQKVSKNIKRKFKRTPKQSEEIIISPKPEVRTKPKVEPRPEVKVEPKPEIKVDTKPVIKPEVVEPKPEVKVEPKVEPKPEVKIEPKPESKAEEVVERTEEVYEETKNGIFKRIRDYFKDKFAKLKKFFKRTPKVKEETIVQPKVEPKPEVKITPKAEQKPEVKAEPKPEIKVETKPVIKPEVVVPKPEAKVEPEPKPEVIKEIKKEIKPSVQSESEKEQIIKPDANIKTEEKIKSDVKKLGKKLDGRITVNVPKKPNNFEHQQLQKEYDKLAIQPEKTVHKTLSELKEQIADSWRNKTRSLVAEKENQLDGRITVNVPKKPTNFEHQQLQKEYDKLAIQPEKTVHKTLSELKEQITDFWRNKTRSLVAEKENQLDGRITVNVPKKPTHYEHKMRQKEYDKLAIQPEKKIEKKPEITIEDELAIEQAREEDYKRYAELIEREKRENELKAAKTKVKKFENKLDGRITVNVPKKPNNFEHQQLQKQYDKLAIQPEKTVHKTLSELKEQIADSWRNKTRSLVAEKEQQLDGRIKVNVPKKPTYKEHKMRQKEYDKLAIQPEKTVHKTLSELKEQIAGFWRNKTRSLVAEKENQLDGRITVNVPKKPTHYEHKMRQKEYDKLAIQPEKKIVKKHEVKTEDKLAIQPEKKVNKVLSETKEQLAEKWQKNSQAVVSDYERKLDGKISVNVPKKPTHYEHKMHQKEYDKLTPPSEEKQALLRRIIERAKAISAPVAKTKEYQGMGGEQLSIEPISKFTDTDEGVTVVRNVVKGLNDAPEGFNDAERNFTKYLRGNSSRTKMDKVTGFPKLYAGEKERKIALKTLFSTGFPSISKIKEVVGIMREEKTAKKAYEQAKKAHIERRIKDFARHTGVGDPLTAITGKYYIPKEETFSARKYASMSKERPTEKDWGVEMTREEFMKNKEQYMTENFLRERRTNGVHNFEPRVEHRKGFFAKAKRMFGF